MSGLNLAVVMARRRVLGLFSSVLFAGIVYT